jgi:Fic family protein
LKIEGNTLSEEQITAILEKKRVVGPKKDVNEVLNAIKVYEQLHKYKPESVKSFLSAHDTLMKGLVVDCGKFRNKGVGIMAGEKLAHVAPPAENVPYLMNDLFNYLKSTNEIALIKSCVFHYEVEFIHPFSDGNGRMGRLWQTLILMKQYPVFEFIPFENLIHFTQNDYYKALAHSDKAGNSTPFIEYMLGVIDESLSSMLDFKGKTMSSKERLNYFIELTTNTFSRKDYMGVFKEISTATASRDLKLGVELGFFEKQGDKTNTIYKML